MEALGINTDLPRNWNRWWLLMWLVSSAAVLTLAFLLPFWLWWLLAAVLGFGIPEAISLIKQNDDLPPLTHTIRHFLPDWFAFPLIYFLLGSIGAEWLEFRRPFHVGAMFGLLGWLTDHFSVTYAHPDPLPYSGGDQTDGPRRLPS